jgi:hypothetical protein
MKNLILASVVLSVVLVIRLPFIGDFPDGWDGADFILGIQKFDIHQQRPHFPGYPVYMLLAKAFKAVGFSYHPAALLPGLVMQCLMIFFLWIKRDSRNSFSWFDKITLLVLLLCHPMISLWSLKVGTETLGNSLLVICTIFFPAFYRQPGEKKDSFFLHGILFGLLLGVRLSYWPFLISFFGLALFLQVGRSNILDMIKGNICGIGVWLIPLIFISGGPYFYITAKKFIYGHFFRWGNTAFTFSAMGARLKLFIWACLTHALAGPWKDLSWIRYISGLFGFGLALYGFIFYPKKKLILFMVLPYLVWLFFFQNLTHPRHFYPLALAFIWCCMVGLVYLKEKISFRLSCPAGTVLAALWLGISINLCIKYKYSVPPQVELVRYVQKKYPGTNCVIFCGESIRMFDLYYPLTPRVKTNSINKMLAWLDQKGPHSYAVLFTSEVQPKTLVDKDLVKFEREFSRSRYLSAESPLLSLFRYYD